MVDLYYSRVWSRHWKSATYNGIEGCWRVFDRTRRPSWTPDTGVSWWTPALIL